MKAYIASDRNGDGCVMVCFAESAGKARAYAAGHEDFDEYKFTDIRVRRVKALDRCYRGRRQMDWGNMDDRVMMAKEANMFCGYEYDRPLCDSCDAKDWCSRWWWEHEK